MNRPLFVYNGGFLTETRVRRILALAGWDVRLGVPSGEDDAVGVWGASPTAPRGTAVARATDAPVVSVEDAFLRSVRPGRVGKEPPIGLCIDESGVHFDADAPSDLETLLRTHPLDDTVLLDRARDAIARMTYWHLGKYAATDPSLPVPAPGYVVVLDQTRGDAALKGAGEDDFREMLTAARDEDPGAHIYIKTHPETAMGARLGHFSADDLDDRTSFLTEPVSLWHLFDGAVGVYTHSSLAGFEAIFAGHKPRVFGTPFYAGWTRTTDEVRFSRRGRELTRAQLFAAAMILYPKWYDPVADALCEVEDAISALASSAEAWRQDNQGWVGTGMRRWKRGYFRRYFPGIRFATDADAAARKATRRGRKVMVWGTTEAKGPVVRVEDGPLRSRGLGADLLPPVSLSFDDLGLGFDPSGESRLERLIAESKELPLAEIRRSEDLIGRIKAQELTKYNISDGSLPELPEGHRILVAGQVEDDASVLLGASEWRTNAALLAETRRRCPSAVILWKPHPDVEAGLRPGAVEGAEEWADVTLSEVSARQALGLADEVWTLTSTLGFEALLRGLPVTCLGTPFYAGWGLTTDLVPTPERRTGDISLAGLAHAALIGHPRYFNPETGAAISPEQALLVLARPAESLSRLARAQRFVRKLGL